jgi:putative colanic acid biosynthesis glycosyltransferase WcaI
MRVLLLNQFYKPDVAATGQLLADVAEKLAECGHEVDVIYSRRRYDGAAWSAAAVETVEGVHIYRVRTTGFGRHRLAGRALDYLSFYVSAAWRALLLPRPDVCVALTTPPFIAVVAWGLSKLRRTRSVLWVMDVYPEIAAAYGVLQKKSLLYRLFARLNRVLYRNATAVISLGEVMTQRLVATGVPGDRLYTVHNWTPGEAVREGAADDSAQPLAISS